MSAAMKYFFLLFVITTSLFCLAYVNGHGHSHDEPAEPASFKYSKQANEAQGPKVVGKPGHGNSHDGHHEHDNHQHHAHSHGGDTGHDHGSHAHSHDHKASEGADHAHGNAHDSHKHSSDSSAGKSSGFDAALWVKALGATALVSITPVFILLLIPVENANDDRHQPLLKILLAFASGGLLGDAFLHLIPHAVSPHSHTGDGHSHDAPADNSHGHSHGAGGHDLSVGLWVLAGIIAFLCVEKFVRLVKGDHAHSHGHAAPKPVEAKSKKEGKDSTADDKKTDSKDKDTKTDDDKPVDEKESLKIAGYLNLAADFAHNFTDGLTIGASFLAGQSVGVITTLTILLHEVPHEIGDFAILVQSGCSKRKAMMLQFTTAIGAMCGTVVSLTAGGLSNQATLWILPFTAGGFIYIATVSVIPELIKDTKLGQSIKEIIALLIGVYMMVLIAQYE